MTPQQALQNITHRGLMEAQAETARVRQTNDTSGNFYMLPPVRYPTGAIMLTKTRNTQVTQNPYLEGNFAPVSTEVTTHNLKVRGTIPKELNGRLVRIGPNPVTALPVRVPFGFHGNWFPSHSAR
jgi:hypothetical protein